MLSATAAVSVAAVEQFRGVPVFSAMELTLSESYDVLGRTAGDGPDASRACALEGIWDLAADDPRTCLPLWQHAKVRFALLVAAADAAVSVRARALGVMWTMALAPSTRAPLWQSARAVLIDACLLQCDETYDEDAIAVRERALGAISALANHEPLRSALANDADVRAALSAAARRPPPRRRRDGADGDGSSAQRARAVALAAIFALAAADTDASKTQIWDDVEVREALISAAADTQPRRTPPEARACACGALWYLAISEEVRRKLRAPHTSTHEARARAALEAAAAQGDSPDVRDHARRALEVIDREEELMSASQRLIASDGISHDWASQYTNTGD